MITSRSVRLLILENRDLIRSLMLTRFEEKLYDFLLLSGPSPSQTVAKHFKITPSNASTRLGSLVNKGYLTRTDMRVVGGGHGYKYSAISSKELNDNV